MNPLEVKVAFDRPLDAQQLKAAEIEMGQFVWEGDQQEWIWPGYEVVKAAKKSAKRNLKVTATKVSKDGRTVTFSTAPQPWRARYRITVPGVVSKKNETNRSPETATLSYDMGGVQATWTAKGSAKPSWSGWLPHIDSNVIRAITTGSAEHDQLQKLLQQPGRLEMRSLLLLPGRDVTFRFESTAPFQVKSDGINVTSTATHGKQSTSFSISAKSPVEKTDARGGREQVLPTEEVRILISVRTGNTKKAFAFDASYHADFDSYERPLRLEHLFVPWAPTLRPPQSESTEGWSGEVIAGDPEKGREIFFGKEANCASCHTFAGKGAKIAADLTVSIHRDPEAVRRDILNPSASINPDYVSYSVLTKNGKTLTGLFRSANEKQITLIDNKAKSHTVERDEIEEIRASAVSLMPTGFDKLGKDKLQNLIAFLCTEDAQARENGLSTGVIRREYWLNVPGSGINALLKHKAFPDKPSGVSLLTRFEAPVNWKDQYGARIRGYVHPPQTGDYTFWVAADDHAELWLSDSENPQGKARIVNLNRWTRSRDWNAHPEQKSKPIHLEAGKRYYIEALHHEATVDDCLAIGWQLPDGEMERPIPGKRLSTFGHQQKK